MTVNSTKSGMQSTAVGLNKVLLRAGVEAPTLDHAKLGGAAILGSNMMLYIYIYI